MGYGRRTPYGSLPVYSVGDEAEARYLLTLTCPTNINGEFIARELAEDQTLPNLYRFGDRLHAAHANVERAGRCRCTRGTDHAD